jgi:hypothetical protein
MHPRGLARDTCCDRWLVLASCCLMARSTVADRLHRLPSATSVPHCLVAIAIEFIGLERDKTEAMYFLRYRMVLLTLMACVASTGTGSNRSTHDGVQDADLSLVDQSVAERVTSELAISDEQRGHIFDGVMRISDAPVAGGPTPEVADALPEQVPMQDLPSDVTQDIPLVHGHKFVKFNDRILIVNASSRSVVAMIPRYKLLP